MIKHQIPRIIFVTDADNTLWDTDNLYRTAQLALLTDVEESCEIKYSGQDRLGFIRQIDQEIAAKHHHGLKYPPKILSAAIILVLRDLSIERASRLAIKNTGEAGETILLEKVERQFFSHLSNIPKLRDGVKSGLNAIASMDIPIWILTEGSKEKCEELLAHYGIQHLIERIMEGKKGTTIYRRIRKLGDDPDLFFMVGDQIDRDIQYANCEGYTTIYFPGGFAPRWSVDARSSDANYVVSSYLEVVNIVKDFQESEIVNSRVTASI